MKTIKVRFNQPVKNKEQSEVTDLYRNAMKLADELEDILRSAQAKAKAIVKVIESEDRFENLAKGIRNKTIVDLRKMIEDTKIDGSVAYIKARLNLD
jgi:exonuclease VII small subunit